MKLELSTLSLASIKKEKSPYPSSPYVAKLQVTSKSNLLIHSEVVKLHEFVRELCPKKFAWWAPLPPELWIDTLIYRAKRPNHAELPNIWAMRLDIQPNKQFSSDLSVLLTPGQLITFRKYSYRIRSDWEEFASSGIEERGL
ncbi:MAG: hypothetical protein AAFW70_12065 [Cyanobacteria bacterium J06635_10]